MIAGILISIVALLHAGFMVLEMFFWTKPAGMKVFHMTLEKAKATAVLAANQGLYNGFLAAGLTWSLVHPNPDFAQQIAAFFLVCVIAAGLYGAWSVNKRIFFVQALPAILALTALFLT
jgi:putative membrane protein